ncbi:hypothetical protein M1146_06605 [Patescibacteria group bacterium]|nr:hypothetical protein [Patescibacteria group bacterium]
MRELQAYLILFLFFFLYLSPFVSSLPEFIPFNFSLTNLSNFIQRITAAGSSNVAKNVDEIYIDKENLLVTTPAYSCCDSLDKIFEGM